MSNSQQQDHQNTKPALAEKNNFLVIAALIIAGGLLVWWLFGGSSATSVYDENSEFVTYSDITTNSAPELAVVDLENSQFVEGALSDSSEVVPITAQFSPDGSKALGVKETTVGIADAKAEKLEFKEIDFSPPELEGKEYLLNVSWLSESDGLLIVASISNASEVSRTFYEYTISDGSTRKIMNFSDNDTYQKVIGNDSSRQELYVVLQSLAQDTYMQTISPVKAYDMTTGQEKPLALPAELSKPVEVLYYDGVILYNVPNEDGVNILWGYDLAQAKNTMLYEPDYVTNENAGTKSTGFIGASAPFAYDYANKKLYSGAIDSPGQGDIVIMILEMDPFSGEHNVLYDESVSGELVTMLDVLAVRNTNLMLKKRCLSDCESAANQNEPLYTLNGDKLKLVKGDEVASRQYAVFNDLVR